MADLFSRRAAASEAAHAREMTKEDVRALRRKLIDEGILSPQTSAPLRPPATPDVTVDVLAAVSANSLPLPKQMDLAEPVRSTIRVPAPATKGHFPKPPRTLADSPTIHLGKGRWVDALSTALEPRGAAAAVRPPPALQLQKRIELGRAVRQGEAAVLASASFIVGSCFCAMGAVAAGTLIWSRRRQPDAASARDQLRASQTARLEALREGAVGAATLAVGGTAERAIKESESLRELEHGLKAQFGRRR